MRASLCSSAKTFLERASRLGCTANVPPLSRHLTAASLRARSFQLRDRVDTARSMRFFSSSQDLYKILTREHAEEIESDSTALPAELAKLKTDLEEDWKIVDDGAMTKLYRNNGPSKVQVSFHCQDTVEVLAEDYGDEDVGEEAAGPVRFTVTVGKAGKTLVFTCLSEDATARIQSVAMTTEAADTVQVNSGVDSVQYQGPEFGELADDLQGAFHSYLEEEVGVSEDVASFVSMYSDYREELEYVQFLEDAQNIIS